MILPMSDPASILRTVHAVDSASLTDCKNPLCAISFPQTGLSMSPRRFCYDRSDKIPTIRLFRFLLWLSPSNSNLSLNFPCFVRKVSPRDCDDVLLILRVAIDRCGVSGRCRCPSVNSQLDVAGEVLKQALIGFSIDGYCCHVRHFLPFAGKSKEEKRFHQSGDRVIVWQFPYFLSERVDFRSNAVI